MVDSHHRACAHIRVSCSCQICKTCGLLEGPSAPLSISIQWQLHGPVQKKPIIISTQLVGSDPMQTKSSCPTCRKTLARLLFTVFPLCSRSQISQVYISRLCVYIYVCVCISLSLSLFGSFLCVGNSQILHGFNVFKSLRHSIQLECYI